MLAVQNPDRQDHFGEACVAGTPTLADRIAQERPTQPVVEVPEPRGIEVYPMKSTRTPAYNRSLSCGSRRRVNA